MAQWAAAVGVASLVYRSLAGDDAGETSTARRPSSLALLAFAVTNEIAMALVLRLVNPVSMRQVLRDLAPEYVPHALIWSRERGARRALRRRGRRSCRPPRSCSSPRWRSCAGATRRTWRCGPIAPASTAWSGAVAHLAAPIDPQDALPTFLDDIRASFASTTVELVLFDPPHGAALRRRTTPDEAVDRRRPAARRRRGRPARQRLPARTPPVAAALVAAGHRDAARRAAHARRPRRSARSSPTTARGHEGFEEGEEAVMAALAAVAARAIEKSELLGVIVEERRQLAEIVDRSSDGILTVGADGTVESWNPAMEEMTGVAADDIVGTARHGPVRAAGRRRQAGALRPLARRRDPRRAAHHHHERRAVARAAPPPSAVAGPPSWSSPGTSPGRARSTR